MKKVIFISLLLMGVFLIGSVAQAVPPQCNNWTCYQCNGTYSCGDGILDEWQEIVGICRDDANRVLEIEGNCWGCDLGGKSLFSSNKNLVGLGGSCGPDYIGCSVELRGRSMTVDVYDIDDCMWQFRCGLINECPI